MEQKSDMLMGLSNNIQGSIPIADNESKDGKLEFAGDTQDYIFTAQADDLIEIYLDDFTSNGRGRIRLLDTDGMTLLDSDNGFAGKADAAIGENFFDSSTLPYKIATDGTYTLLVDGLFGGTGDYTLGLTNFTQGALTIADNQSINDTVTFAGDGEAYTFTAKAGDLIEAYVDNLTDGAPKLLRIRLLDSEGNLLDSDSSVNTFGDDVEINDPTDPNLPFKITQDGTYTLLVDGIADTTGSYTLSLTGVTFEPATFDIDGNGVIEAAVDGLLFYGYLNVRSLPPSLRDSLTQQLADNLITDNNATRTTGEAIASYLENHLEMMDIDGNNDIEAAVDGLLAYGYLNIRSLPPFLRDSLTQQLADNLITDENASRITGEEISAFMNQFII